MPAQADQQARHPRRRLAVLAAVVVLALLGAVGGAAAQDPTGPRVLATTVEGAITPVISDHLGDGIARAGREGFDAYLVRLDTPGGLDTSMRDIVQDILASEVPVIVHIAPSGARGASAGAVITFAAHVAAMAPGTAIGAATPVGGGGGEDLDAKVINDAAAYVESLAELRDRNVDFAIDTVREGRSAGAREALELGAIDVVAGSTTELLEAIDGRTVVVGDGDREVVLDVASAELVEDDIGLFGRIQQVLADPNIAFLLLSVGTLGLIYELASPGVGVGGALGVTFVVLALFGLAVLPVNAVGLVFLLLAAVLFVAELFAPGIGLAAAGGALALVLSGLFLFDDAPGLELSLAVILPTAVVVAAFVVLAGRFALRARAAPSSTTGTGALVGSRATVRRSTREPQVFVAGAWWSVRTDDDHTHLDDGDEVVVVDVDGLHLVVEPADPDHPTSPTTNRKVLP